MSLSNNWEGDGNAIEDGELSGGGVDHLMGSVVQDCIAHWWEQTGNIYSCQTNPLLFFLIDF